MPQIPQSAFDTNPSTRVGGQSVTTVPNAMSGVANAAASLVGAFAQLQDQSERTEAFTKANAVKREFLQEKVQYEAALESSDSNGNYSYIDPTDGNPDVSKRRRVEGKLADRYAAMKNIYDKGMNDASGLARGDISRDLMTQYIGDDLIQTQLRTNRIMIRRKEKEVTESALENMQLKLNSVMEAFSADAPNPEMTRLKIAQVGNSIDRELAAAAPIIGTENTAKLTKARDRAYSTAAAEIIRNGLNNSSVNAAEQLVSRIRSPLERQLASGRIEREKKAAATQQQYTMFKQGIDLGQSIQAADSIDDQSYLRAVETSRRISNMYIDPKYSPVTREQADAAAADLLSTALAKRTFQQRLDQNMEFLDSYNPASRDPSGMQDGSAGAPGRNLPPGSAQLANDLDTEIEESGIGRGFGDNIRSQLQEKTLLKMKGMRASLSSNVADWVTGAYPGLQGVRRIEKINQVAQEQGLGYVPLASRKEIAAFKQSFSSSLAKGAMPALAVFEQQIIQAGGAQTGNQSYRRGLAMDLADKDPNMAFIIPLADAQGGAKLRMLDNASKYRQNLDDFDLTDDKLDKAFGKYGLSTFDGLSGTNVYSGIKQAIYHEAAARYADNKNLNRSMEEAVGTFSNMYSTLKSADGRSKVVLLNTQNGFDYSSNKEILKQGVKASLSMPQISYEKKAALLERLVPQAGIRAADGKIAATKDMIDTTMRALVAVEPDPRYPNVHRYTVNKTPLLDEDGNVIEVTADQFLEFGQALSKKALTRAQQQGMRVMP